MSIGDKVTAEYSADLKLAVVLEFIQSRKRKKAICRKYGLTEQLLDEWHRQFEERARYVFASPQTLPTQSAAQPKGDTTNPIAPIITPEIPSWGAKINVGYLRSHHWPNTASTEPAWFKWSDREHWTKRGMLIWDSSSQQSEFLSGQRALDLLKQLEDMHSFQEGVVITHEYNRIKIPPPAKTKRKRKSKTALALEPEPKSEEELVIEERFRLNAHATAELYQFLQAHAEDLQEIAKTDEKERQEALSQVFKLMLTWAREAQEKEIDLEARPMPWIHTPETHTWVCNVPPNRGTVSLSETRLYWHSCIERPDQFKHESALYLELEDALAWTEKELLWPAKGTDSREEEDSSDDNAAHFAVDLALFWIDPSALEPEHVTYRVIMEIHASPESFKTMEMSFGKQFRYGEKYPSASKLSSMLSLPEGQLKLEQPGRERSRWYIAHSTTTYFQEYVAAMQAQQFWDRSAIAAQYHLKKITSARYGFEEVETGYCTWLGALDDPEDPWPGPSTREKYLEERALEETIIYALDVERLRNELHLSRRLFSDEKVLSILHHRRARSRYIPEAAREESKRWLFEHEPETNDLMDL